MTPDVDDRRRHPRVPLYALVQVRTDASDEFWSELGVNLSVGGLFLETPEPYAPGSFLELRFSADPDDAVIEGVGRVMYRAEGGPAGTTGVGVRFLHLVEPSLSRVYGAVRRRLERGLALPS